MPDLRDLSEDEIRRRYAAEVGVSVADLAGTPAAQLRAVLADIDDQAETYAALGMPAEADRPDRR